MDCAYDGVQDLSAQKPEPEEQESEILPGGGQDGVDGVALAVCEVVSAHSMLGFEVSDDRLDGGAASELSFDLIGDASLLAAVEGLQAVFVGGVVAVIAGVGDDALKVDADLLFELRQDGGQGVTVVGSAG